MKRRILTLLLIAIISFTFVGALSSCLLLGSNLTYTAIEQDGEVVSYSVKKGRGTNVTIPAEHKGKPVTKIERFAFHYCRSLQSVSIPNTITEIGWDAFAYCNRLKKVYIDDLSAYCNIKFEGDWATPFYYKADIYVDKQLVKDLRIPDGVTQIPMDAFQGCNVSSVTLPSSVQTIHNGAFSHCNELKNVYLGEGLEYISGYAFAWSKALEEITFPEGFKDLGDCAFFSCSGLKSVTIPHSIESIDSEAFKYCYRIAQVNNYSDFNIRKGAESYGYVGTYAYNIVNGDGEAAISKTDDGYVFYTYEDKKYLIDYTGTEAKITLPSISTVGDYIVGAYAFYERGKITDVTVADGVKIIGNCAFDDCQRLKNVELPQSVTSIGALAFCNCKSLKSIVIPDGVSGISYAAFLRCASLESVTLPENLEVLVDASFFDTALSEIVFKGTKEQWELVEKMKGWTNVKNYTVRCSDGQIQIGD